MARHHVAVIPGDGIGQEVVPVATAVLDAALPAGSEIVWEHKDWGSDHYRTYGAMMPPDGLESLLGCDAIFFGAVGAPDVPDEVTLWGLLMPIRQTFQQYVNLRPVRYRPGVRTPIRRPEGIDLVIVRENVEGEYTPVGGRINEGTASEGALQTAVFTRTGVARVARYAAELALTRRGKVTSATKTNGIVHTMPFWDAVVREAMDDYPAVSLQSMLVDALAAALIRKPQSFDVIVASNLMGDILSDLAAECVGSLGLAPSGNINPEREYPSMFEPVHGSAPDIAGTGTANPLGQVYAGAMLLTHLGEHEAAALVNAAADAVLAAGPRTLDLGGTADTCEVGRAVVDRLLSMQQA